MAVRSPKVAERCYASSFFILEPWIQYRELSKCISSFCQCLNLHSEYFGCRLKSDNQVTYLHAAKVLGLDFVPSPRRSSILRVQPRHQAP